jgi:hypothetical protein
MIAVEPPRGRGATREHTRRYATEEQRSPRGWIDRERDRVVHSRARRWLALAVIASGAAGACKKHTTALARLDETHGQVEQTQGAGSPWRPAAVGDTFVLGNGVRTGKASRARITIGKSGKLDVDPEAVVYFTRDAGKKRDDVHVETGGVELEAGDEALGFGDALLEPNAHARVASTPQGVAITVTLGRLLLEADDPSSAVEAGKTVTVPEHGKPVVATTSAIDAGVARSKTGAISVKVTGTASKKTPKGVEPLAPGESGVEPGSEIALSADSTLEIVRDGARAVVTGKSTVQVGGTDGDLAKLGAGTVAVYDDATIAVPGGTVHAEPAAESFARVDASGTAVEARRGETVIHTQTGDSKLAYGESATLATTGAVALDSRPPAHVSVTVAAGESPVIHDVHAPTAVGVKLDATCATGGVEIARDRSFKRVIARSVARDLTSNVMLAAGTYAYRVSCEGGPTTIGTIRILSDSGRAPLPKAAPHTQVEADGREYTILYQNLLPELTLSWRNARSAASYTFVVKPKVGEPKRFPSTTPKVGLRAGELGEGSYKFWVETPAGKSEEARIVIEFDNAASSASLESVDVKDGEAHVRGVVIDGSTVSSGGVTIPLDRHLRFETVVAPRVGDTGLAIRIAHPKAGVHYYVVGVAATSPGP